MVDTSSSTYPEVSGALSNASTMVSTSGPFSTMAITKFITSDIQPELYAITSDPGSTDGGAIVQTMAADSDTVLASSTSVPSFTTSVALPTASTDSGAAASSSHRVQYDKGTVAGAVTGAAIGAAIVACLMTIICIRRQRPGYRSDMAYEKTAHPRVTPCLPDNLTWMKYLPQPEDDNAIKMAMQILYQQIELHVENFYHGVETPVSEFTREPMKSLSDLEKDNLLNSKSSLPTIKRSLARLILNNISTDDPPGSSFLPSQFASLTQTLRSSHSDDPSGTQPPGYNTATRTILHSQVTSQPLSFHRVLTAYLSPDPSSDACYMEQRDARIERVAMDFCTLFEHWTISTSNAEVMFQNLVEIMRGAADVGILVSSQPASFVYQWDTCEHVSDDDRHNIMILPDFVKVSDNQGNSLGTRVVFVAGVSSEAEIILIV